MRNSAMIVPAALISAFFLGEQARSAEIKSGNGKSGQAVVWIIGEIVPGDADKFTVAVKQANDSGKFVANVRLNSEGGNLVEGVKIAESIKFAKMSTNVGKSAVCASACFLMFAAGSTKFASYGAQIGVHGASERGQETITSNAATVSMAKIAGELGVPSAIIGRMVVTAPSDMVWLNPQELQSMGTTMMGRPSQTDMPPTASLQQTAPSDPLSLSPSSANTTASQSAKTDGVLTWAELLNKTTELSARQNGGKPLFTRSCQPELKVCITGLSYLDNKGRIAFLKAVEDMNGKIITREACTLNEFKDVRTCVDWDRGTFHRDMKANNGEWSQISDD